MSGDQKKYAKLKGELTGDKARTTKALYLKEDVEGGNFRKKKARTADWPRRLRKRQTLPQVESASLKEVKGRFARKEC